MAVTKEYINGKVSDIYDADTGQVTEGESPGGPTHDFHQNGAQLNFKLGQQVTFLRITLPNGKRLAKEVGQRQ
ncbi:MAG: hypothetical protein ACI9J3_001841 [Parvicellaceae bacterium]|jgi:hypothetical protein